MPLYTYNYTKDPINAEQISDEVRESDITVALDHVVVGKDYQDQTVVTFHFKAELPDPEEIILDEVVAEHVADFTPKADLVVTSTLDKDGVVIPDGTIPVTLDGETLTIQGNMANVTGNELINWTMFYTLGADTGIDERFMVPSGVTASIEFVQGYSAAGPFSVEVNWYSGPGSRINSAISPRDYAMQTVDGDHISGSTEIKLKGGQGFSFSAMETDKKYAFYSNSTGKTFVRRVTSKDRPSSTVTLSNGAPFDLLDGDCFTLVDRPIARLGGDGTNALMDFEVAPSFKGDGKGYLELVIKNESLTDSGDVFAVVNGWTTSTTGGTIPGAGGASGVDNNA